MVVGKKTKKEGIIGDIEKGTSFDLIVKKRKTTINYVKSVHSEMGVPKDARMMRPTPVNRDVYIEFGNKCRSNDCEVRDVLTEIMQKYIDEK